MNGSLKLDLFYSAKLHLVEKGRKIIMDPETTIS